MTTDTSICTITLSLVGHSLMGASNTTYCLVTKCVTDSQGLHRTGLTRTFGPEKCEATWPNGNLDSKDPGNVHLQSLLRGNPPEW